MGLDGLRTLGLRKESCEWEHQCPTSWLQVPGLTTPAALLDWNFTHDSEEGSRQQVKAKRVITGNSLVALPQGKDGSLSTILTFPA